MRFLLKSLASHLRTSFWFIPGMLVLAAGALAFVTLAVDELDPAVLDSLGYIVRGEFESSRTLLSVLGMGVITVASIVFSITIVTLSIASNQYGPRLIRMFMRDRGNQAVLGVFLMTFVFCVLVLMNMSGEEAGDVPRLSLLTAVVLTMVSVGVLIYFIHHIAMAVQAETVVRRVSQEIHDQAGRWFPGEIGDGADPASASARPPEGPWTAITAQKTGYLQTVDGDRLIETCLNHSCVVRLLHQPGKYIIEGMPLLEVLASSVDDDLREHLRRPILIGDRRTIEQDIQFPISELVEIIERALSTGINDAAVAIACLDGLSGALCACARTETPYAHRVAKGQLCVIAPPVTFEEILDGALGPIRQNARGNHAVSTHLLVCLERVAACTQDPDRRAALRRHAELVLEDARRNEENDVDVKVLSDRFRRVMQALGAPADGADGPKAK